MEARIPCSTYRLQFNKQFTFNDARAIVPYLHALGIGDVYASPYLKARPGSLHGYDIVDPQALNPEVGTEDEYRAFVEDLGRHHMGQLLDVVPNHMCVTSSENRWWADVLENGPSSRFVEFFDIDWDPVKPDLVNKVLLPVLGKQFGAALESRELALAYEDGAFVIRYYEHRFPVRPKTEVDILGHRIDEFKAASAPDDPHLMELLSIITGLNNLPEYTEQEAERRDERVREKEVVRRRLGTLIAGSERVRAFVDENIAVFNGEAGNARSFDLLDRLLDRQAYRLSHWRVATEEINYRRFFDINDLAAIRMEDPAVFSACHELIFRLIRSGAVTGLRVDHPDGLYDPAEYFRMLQRHCAAEQEAGRGGAPAAPAEGERPVDEAELLRKCEAAMAADATWKPFYIVGEKILTRSERMPEDWPIFSTTGYVFLNSVNGIFVDTKNAKAFDRIYDRFIRQPAAFSDIAYKKKKGILELGMSGEMITLGHRLDRLSEKDRHTRDFTLNSLTKALAEVIAFFPVYRTYITSPEIKDKDRQYIEHAVARAKRENPVISESVFDFIRDVLLLRFPADFGDGEKRAWIDFVMRFQQLTGPVMAKGMEDTAFYVYNRLVSLNEVGGSPDRFGIPLETFHGQNIERIKCWPQAMITTATHDAKRGEDVRARINVLSEIPEEWRSAVTKWHRMNRKKKKLLDGREAPDRNEEYLLYQTLIGAWPAGSGEAPGDFVQRISDYMLKAAREAKVNTSWINPNAEYESALTGFVEAVLRRTPANAFLKDFAPFQQMVAHYGMYNSLSQTLLKICAPGVPDFYQGTDLWDFRLVDPDNRGPVDYGMRMRMLEELAAAEKNIPLSKLAWDLSLAKDDGRIKLFVVSKALHFRRERRRLFEQGDYVPLDAAGAKAEHICAFERRQSDASVIVASPRFLTRLISGSGSVPFGGAVWEESRITLSLGVAGAVYRNVFTGESVTAVDREGSASLLLADVLSCFPVALLERVS